MAVLLYVLGVVVFLGALFVSIALHELGHLAFARRFGCRVSEYMVGFGPRLFSWKRGETEYGIKLIPLGGYVKIVGMFPPATKDQERVSRGELSGTVLRDAREEQEKRDLAAAAEQATEDAPMVLRSSNTGLFTRLITRTRATEFELVEPGDADRLFYKLSAPRKVAVMLAGPAVNLVLAFVCLLAVYGIHGTHAVEPTGSTVVVSVAGCVVPASSDRTECGEEDPLSPAAAAGLQPGDEVTGFNGVGVTSWDHLSDLIHENQDGPMQLVVMRDGEQVELEPASTVSMVRDLDGEGPELAQEVGYLGATPETETVITRYGPVWVLGRMVEMTGNAVMSIVELPGRVWNVALAVAGLAERDADGPMSVIGGSRIAGEVASSDEPGLDVGGKAAMLGLVVGSFNLFIGVFNLVPLLPLDGGHILGAAYEGLRRFFAKLLRRPDPGFVNTAAQLPLAYLLGAAIVVMGGILMLGDLIVPLSSGL